MRQRVNNRLKRKATVSPLCDHRGLARKRILFGDKIPGIARWDFEIVFFFSGFDKGAEKPQRTIVVRQLIAGCPFIQHLLKHFFPVVTPEIKQLHPNMTKPSGRTVVMQQLHQIVVTGVVANMFVDTFDVLFRPFEQLEKVHSIE
ncbi:hypothetical protein D3C78_1226260 [compost metagenome]